MNDLQKRRLKNKAIEVFSRVFSDFSDKDWGRGESRQDYIDEIAYFCEGTDISIDGASRLLSVLTREIATKTDVQKNRIREGFEKFIDELKVEIKNLNRETAETLTEGDGALPNDGTGGGEMSESELPRNVLRGPWGERKK